MAPAFREWEEVGTNASVRAVTKARTVKRGRPVWQRLALMVVLALRTTVDLSVCVVVATVGQHVKPNTNANQISVTMALDVLNIQMGSSVFVPPDTRANTVTNWTVAIPTRAFTMDVA